MNYLKNPVSGLDACAKSFVAPHFERYANPMNMFILPKEIGGLGEIQEFIDEQRFPKQNADNQY